MNAPSRILSAVAALIVVAGCSSGTDEGQPTVTQWLGEQPHLAISGTFQEQTFDVHLEGDAAGVHCERYYAPLPGAAPDADGNYDTSQVYFVMKELGAVIDLDGVATEFSISYWRHDIAADQQLTVVPRTFGTALPEGETWSDVDLFAVGAEPTSGIESAASSGTVSMRLNTGLPDANGVMIPDGGRTGEFISVTWGPRESLNVSASADCGPSQVVPWAAARILP